MQEKYTYIDLFAGCGGLSEGFLQEGNYKSLAHVEWEKSAVDTLRHRLENRWGYTKDEARREVIMFDIQQTEELIQGLNNIDSIKKYTQINTTDFAVGGLRRIINYKNVDLIIGGPPCQAYSIHGRATDKNSMQDDYRNYLFESFVKVVNEFKPRVFVFENVPGMLSAKPGGRHVTERIYEAFDEIGYKILPPDELNRAIYNSVDFGVPQERKRVIILGIKVNSDLTLSGLYDAITAEKSNNGIVTVREAIYDMPFIVPLPVSVKKGRINVSHEVINPDEKYTQHEPRYHTIRDINIFKKWVSNNMNNITHKEKTEFYKEVTGRSTLYAKYKSLEWDKPSHTIVAHLSKDGLMFIHPDAKQARSITIREAAILMGFPLDFDFIGSTSSCFKMIGNAVPIPLAKAIARGIRNVLKLEK